MPLDDRSLTELEFVEVAVRRAVALVNPPMDSAFVALADELMSADFSQFNGNDTRLKELERLRRIQQ